MEILFYLMVFFLPYMEVPFLEHVFVLKVSNILAMLIMGLLLYESVFRKRKLEFPFLAPLSAYAVTCLVSIGFGMRLPLEKGLEGAAGRNAAGVYSFVTLFWLVFAFFIFWATVNAVRRKEFLINIVRVHLLSAGIVSLWGLWTLAGYLCGIDTGLKFTEVDWIMPRISSTALEPLFFGNYLLSALPLGLGLYFTKRDILNRNLFFCVLIAELFAMLFTFSLGAWGGLAVACVFFGIFCFREISWGRVWKMSIFMVAAAGGLWLVGSRYHPEMREAPRIVAKKFTNIFRGSSYKSTGEYNRVEFVKFEKTGSMEPGMYGFAKITVRNTGTKTWPAGGKNAVHLAYSWIDSKGKERNITKIRTGLARDIKPGEEAELNPCLRAPETGGDYLLKWDMVEEYVGYFEQQERSLPLSMKVKIEGVRKYYGAGFENASALPGKLTPGRKYSVDINVRNTGTIAWNRGGKYPVHLSYRWFDREGRMLPVEGLRTSLPKEVLPGETIRLKALIERPDKVPEGSACRWDMVREYVTWFSEQDRTVSYYERTAEPREKLEYRMNIETINDRWGLWRAGLRMFKRYPVTGVGLGNFSFLYNRYKPADAVYKPYMPVIHNVYLETLVETGLLGMSAFLFFVFSVLKVLLARSRRTGDILSRAIFFALAGCLVGLAFQFNLYGGKTLHYVWIILGLAVAASGFGDIPPASPKDKQNA